MPEDFAPHRIPIAEYPHPVGAVMRGSMGSLSTVVDRDGFAFLACCTTHIEAGLVTGYHPQADSGRLLDRSEPAGISEYVCPNRPGSGLPG